MSVSISDLQKLRENLPSDTPENAALREDLLLEARKLMLALERPDNSVERLCFQLWETAATRTAVDLGIFEALAKSSSPQTVENLVKHTDGADPTLVGRLLRCLESYGVVEKVGDGFVAATTAKAFADPKHQAALEVCFDFLSPGWLAVPEFLKSLKYKNPTSGTMTPFAKVYGHPNGETLWNIMKNTSHVPAFGVWMGSFNDGHKDWLDFYPFQERLGAGASQDKDAVLMVDVGGGQGHQAIGLKKKFPDVPGRLVVQDLPHGLAGASSEGVEFVEHDFMTAQPIQGARFYYFRYISHDWPQAILIEMLTHIRKAMKPGYSKLIINDWIVPSKGASKFMTSQDMNMMSIGGGMERTEELHREYLEGAGLKISGVFPAGDKISESIIEAEVA